jgi:hypothetical protein
MIEQSLARSGQGRQQRDRLSRHPIPMKPWRHAVGDVDYSLGRAFEICRVQDDEISRLAFHIDDIAHHPAIVFSGAASLGHEDELSGDVVGSEIMDLAGARFEIMLVELALVGRGCIEAVGERHGVGVAIGFAHQRFIGAGELLAVGVDHGAHCAARGRVNRPAFEGRAGRVRADLAFGKHAIVRADVHDDLAVLGLERVAGVEDVAGRDIAPDDISVGAFLGEEANTRFVIWVPRIREGVPREQRLHREGDGKIEDDDVVFGDHAIMDGRAILHADRLFAADLAVGIHHHVADRRLVSAFIADCVHLSAIGIEMGVGGEASFQRAAEGIMRDGFKLFIDPDGEAAGFDHGPGLVGDAEDVGVDGVLHRARAGRFGEAERGRDLAALDPAVAIPKRLAALELDAVDHAVPCEPVIGGVVGGRGWVGADADIATIEFCRDAARDGEAIEREFGGHGRVDAGEIGIGLIRLHAAPVEIGNLHDTFGDGGTDQSFNCAGHGELLGA